MSGPRDIAIVPDIRTAEENTAAAQDLAWAHAVTLAQVQGDEVGSDEFVEYYNEFLQRYTVCTDHIGFLQNMALRTVRELLHAGVAVMIPRESNED